MRKKHSLLGVAALVALILSAIPAIKWSDSLIIQKRETQRFQVDVRTLQQQKEELEQKNIELDKQNAELELKLQAKLERQETERKAREAKEAYLASLPVGCANYYDLVSKYFGDVATIAMEVMYAESSCNPASVNTKDNHGACYGSFGLFQIMCTKGELYDPETNIRVASEMYHARGWQPWSVCKNGMVNCNS